MCLSYIYSLVIKSICVCGNSANFSIINRRKNCRFPVFTTYSSAFRIKSYVFYEIEKLYACPKIYKSSNYN
jgi:hypothetical protein